MKGRREMIERVLNEELKQFVYRIEKKSFGIGLKKEIVEMCWKELCGEMVSSVDFKDYRSARDFAGKLTNKYSLYVL